MPGIGLDQFFTGAEAIAFAVDDFGAADGRMAVPAADLAVLEAHLDEDGHWRRLSTALACPVEHQEFSVLRSAADECYGSHDAECREGEASASFHGSDPHWDWD